MQRYTRPGGRSADWERNRSSVPSQLGDPKTCLIPIVKTTNDASIYERRKDSNSYLIVMTVIWIIWMIKNDVQKTQQSSFSPYIYIYRERERPVYIYIYIYIYICVCVCVCVCVSQVESSQRRKKWDLIPPCLTLTIIRYVSREKLNNPGVGNLRIALDYGRQLMKILVICRYYWLNMRSEIYILYFTKFW